MSSDEPGLSYTSIAGIPQLVCLTCGAAVVSTKIHDQWHHNISSVAIESTQRIDQLLADLDRINRQRRG